MAKFSIGVLIGATLGSSYASTFSRASKPAAELGLAIRKTNKELAAARDVIKYKKALEQLREKQVGLGRSSTRLDRGIADLEARYRKAKQSAKGYGIEVGKVTRAERALAKQQKRQMRQQSRRLARDKAGQRLGSARGGLLAGAGVAAGIGALVGQASDFEEKGVRLKTVINAEDTTAALKKSRRHALDFARDSLASETEILEIEYSLNSAGLSAEASRAGTEVVSKVAKVTNGSAAEVGVIIGDVFNNIGAQLDGDAAQRLSRVGDVLTKTQLLFSIKDFGQLGESMKQGLVGALSYKVSLEQTAAAIGQLNSSGLKGSQAGTAFNAMLRQLAKGAKEFGFDMVRTKDGQLDVIQTLKNMRVALAGIGDEEEKNARLQKAFGDEGKKGTVLLLNSLEKLEEGYRKVKDESSGIVDQSYQQFLDSTSGKLTRMGQNVSQLGTVFAGSLLPAVTAIVEPLTSFVGWLGKAIESNPVAAQVVGALAGALGAAGIAIGLIAAAQWVWNVAMLASPIGLVVGALVAIGVGAFALWKNWDTIWTWVLEKFTAVWASIKATFNAVWQPIQQAFSSSILGKVISAGASLIPEGSGPNRSSKIAQGARNAAAAAVIASTPVAAGAAQPTINNNQSVTMSITQQPGESGDALAVRVADEIEQRRGIDQRGALHDGGT